MPAAAEGKRLRRTNRAVYPQYVRTLRAFLHPSSIILVEADARLYHLEVIAVNLFQNQADHRVLGWDRHFSASSDIYMSPAQ